MGAPSLPLGPPLPNAERATTSTAVPNAAKNHALPATAAKSATEISHPTGLMTPHQKLEPRVIRSHQTADTLLSMKPHTPTNIPLLTDLLKAHPNQLFVTKLSLGLSQGFWVGYQGTCFPCTARNLPSANQKPLLIEENLLNEVLLGRLAGPLNPPRLKIIRFTPLGWSPKRIAKNSALFFTYLTPKGPETG